MLRIRLSRIGKNKHATFRVVVADHARAVKGKAVDVLGSYDPHTNVVSVKTEKVQSWIKKGALLSPTVHNLFVTNNIITGEKVTSWKSPKKNVPTETTPAASSEASTEPAPNVEPAPAPETPAA